MAANTGPNAGSTPKKSDTVVKLLLVFFISILSFAIGTFAGMKLVEQKHKLAQLEPETNKHDSADRQVASESSHDEHASAPAEKTEKMTDEEFNKVVEEFAQDDEPTEENTHVAKPNDAAHQAHSVSPAKQQPAAKPEAHPVAQPKAEHTVHPKAEHSAQSETQRKPTAIAKNVGQYQAAKFTVQIIALPTEEAAQKKASEYKSKGYLAFYYPAQVKGQTWYRVNVGMFATEAEAKAYRKDFMAKSKTESAIIQKISE